MPFLTPLLLLGLSALAIPVLVHLVQREKKRVVEFPSLMFVQRIPYKSVRRRRLRHWFLLLMRAAAMALIVAAFARPFLPGGAAAVAAIGASREVVILLDHSASMGYGDRWDRARAAARDAIGDIGPNDRASLVLFGRNAEETIRSTSDRGRLEAALSTARLTSDGTRYGPALKLAENILTRSTLPKREAILISDFQKTGWSGAEDVQFGETIQLRPVSIATDQASNLSVPSVTFARAPFSNQERVTVTAGVANRGATPASNVRVALEIDGRELESKTVNVAANAAASIAFSPFTLAEPSVRGTVRAGTDPLAADNAFHFVVTPNQPVNVLVVDGGAGSSFYLAKALEIGTAPAFQVEVVPAARVTPAMLERRAVIVFNDTMVPPGIAGGALKAYVDAGGGILIALGERGTGFSGEADLFPGKAGAAVSRPGARGATMAPDYSHPVFEIFKAPRSGDFSAVRVQRYRPIEVAPTDRVIARYDDGLVAAAERRVGSGRIIAWSTSLDTSWTDLAVKPVYLPLVHQLVRYLARYEPPTQWVTVGQVVDLSSVLKGRADRTVVTPNAERIAVPATEPGMLELSEQGVYEIRTGTSNRADRIAVNIDPAESDLTSLDPTELVAAVTGHATMATPQASAPTELTPAEAERHQGLWWYLLVAGMLLLAAEMIVANRVSRTERFL